MVVVAANIDRLGVTMLVSDIDAPAAVAVAATAAARHRTWSIRLCAHVAAVLVLDSAAAVVHGGPCCTIRKALVYGHG